MLSEINVKSEENIQSNTNIMTSEKSNYSGEKNKNMRSMLEPGGTLDVKYFNVARTQNGKRF